MIALTLVPQAQAGILLGGGSHHLRSELLLVKSIIATVSFEKVLSFHTRFGIALGALQS